MARTLERGPVKAHQQEAVESSYLRHIPSPKFEDSIGKIISSFLAVKNQHRLLLSALSLLIFGTGIQTKELGGALLW